MKAPRRPKHKERRNRLSELLTRNLAKPDPVNPPPVNVQRHLYPIVQRHPN